MPLVASVQFRNNCIAIGLDTGESLVVPDSVYAQYGFVAGAQIDAAAYRQLREESERFGCGRKALAYLAARSRSTFELETALRRKGYSGDIIRETVRGLHERGYLDDHAFAKEYAGARKRRGGVGKNLIMRELQRKGVARELIGKAIAATTSDDDDRAAALECARKKLRQIAGKKNRASRLAFFLRSRGFDAGVIRQVVRELVQPEDAGDGAEFDGADGDDDERTGGNE